jgi:hypothetical protein
MRAMVEAGRTPRPETAKAALVAPYNTDDYADALVETYETAVREAETRGLSHGASQRPRMTREQRQAREQGARDRTEKFGPLQAALAEEYGTFAARYLLSNTTVESITKGDTSFRGLDRPFRRAVILEKAAALGIDLSPYD